MNMDKRDEVSVAVAAPGTEADREDAGELDRWLGRREAFGIMAGRCSAADVECMKRIRDGKLYAKRAKDWAEFCEKELHMSKSKVNRLIALRDKWGDAFFLVVQLTGISVAEYRDIAPAVSDRGIECNGEVIALCPENGERIGAAVSSILAAADRPEPSYRERVAALEAACTRLLEQFREMGKTQGTDDPYLIAAVGSLQRKVERLALEIR
jgi:hypothetical protein